MTKFTTLATASALLMLATSAGLAASGSGNPNKMPGGPDIQVRQIKVVACLVAGSPSEFPDDIAIQNKGVALPAGTKISWTVPFSGDHGTYTLTASLAGGKGLYVQGVLPGGVEAGHPCVAQIL